MSADVIVLSLTGVAIISLIVLYILDKRDEKQTLRLFQPGCRLDYYASKYHGKFEKEWVLATYEIVDRDKNYLWVKNINEGKETEINLDFDFKYAPFVLHDKDGNVIFDNRK